MTYPIVEKLRKSGQVIANSVSWPKAGEAMLDAAAHIEALAEALEPLMAKLKLVEEARETWKPSSGPIGDGYTIAIKAGDLRRIRTALSNLREGGGK